jgi:hypothetical protein
MPGVVNDFGITLIGNNAAFGVGNPDTTITTTSAINDGTWHHIAATRDSVSGVMNLYLDGTRQAYATGPAGTRAAAPNLRIGALQTLIAGAFLTGTIDDVQIFSRVFSAAEVPSLRNHPPGLQPIFDSAILAGRTLVVTNSASDPDLPAQTLTFSLQNPPSGAAINPSTGLLTWRPGIAESGANHLLAVRVTDNGTPSQSATQNFLVTVLQPVQPNLNLPLFGASGFNMRISGDIGPDYSVYTTTDVAKLFPNWDWLLTTNPAVLPFQFTDFTATNYGQRFYKVLLGP